VWCLNWEIKNKNIIWKIGLCVEIWIVMFWLGITNCIIKVWELWYMKVFVDRGTITHPYTTHLHQNYHLTFVIQYASLSTKLSYITIFTNHTIHNFPLQNYNSKFHKISHNLINFDFLYYILTLNIVIQTSLTHTKLRLSML